MKHFFSSLLVAAAITACGNSENAEAPDTSTQIDTSSPVTTVAAVADTEKSDTFRLVMLGDSITAGFGLENSRLLTESLDDLLSDLGRDIEVINAGVSGDRMQDGAARFDWSVGPDTDGVLIALGGNDLLRGIDPAVTRGALEAMLQKATDRKLWVGIAGLRAPSNATATFSSEFNSLYDDLSAEFCTPLLPNFLADVIGVPALNQQDGIHPTPEGVSVLVGNLGPWLDEALAGDHNPC